MADIGASTMQGFAACLNIGENAKNAVVGARGLPYFILQEKYRFRHHRSDDWIKRRLRSWQNDGGNQ